MRSSGNTKAREKSWQEMWKVKTGVALMIIYTYKERKKSCIVLVVFKLQSYYYYSYFFIIVATILKSTMIHSWHCRTHSLSSHMSGQARPPEDKHISVEQPACVWTWPCMSVYGLGLGTSNFLLMTCVIQEIIYSHLNSVCKLEEWWLSDRKANAAPGIQTLADKNIRGIKWIIVTPFVS